MKRPLRIMSLLVIVLVLVRGAEYVLEVTLDRKLPPLLTEELGLPVRIAPIRADIISLTAKTSRLEMGEADKLSIDAREVWVSLDWADLLSGEIRLVTGAGREVMVDISAWPKDDGPPADDYANLEQWLPSVLDAGLVRYRREDGVEIEFHQARWRRGDSGNASLAWQSRFPTGQVDVDIDLRSLDDLLWLREFDARVTAATSGEEIPATELALTVRPSEDTAYQLRADGVLAGTPLQLNASGSESWTLPDHSTTSAEYVYVSTLRALVSLFVADGEEDAYRGEIASTVPEIDLPRHDALLDIGELRFGRNMAHDVGFKLTTSGSYLAATRITASGLYGDLLGSAAVASTEDGWDVALAADLTAREADHGLMSRYITSDWLSRQGRIRLKTSGITWQGLLDQLSGDLRVSGAHRNKTETPFEINAKLDGSPERFALEQVEFTLGSTELTGQLEVSIAGDKFVDILARGNATDIGFLVGVDEELQQPGIALPTFLTWLPDYRVTADLAFESLQVPDLRLDNFSARLERGLDAGTMSINGAGPAGGTMQIELAYQETDQGPINTTLDFKLDRVDLPQLFRLGAGAIDSRTSGTVALKAEAGSVKEVFVNSRGPADLDIEIRDDEDWSRPRQEHEFIEFTGDSRLLIEGNSIIGVQLDDIDVESLEQELTGTLSLIVTRDPVMVAELRSERLNIDRIAEWVPESTEAADEEGVLGFLRDAAPGRVNLTVDSLTWLDRSFDNLQLALESRPRYFSVEKLQLGHRGATLDGKLTLDWKDPQVASLDASAEVAQLRLLELAEIDDERVREHLGNPLAGQLRLQSEGVSFRELFAGFNGELLLNSTSLDGSPADKLDISFQRLPDGGLITFRDLELEGSDLQGTLRTVTGTPTRYELELQGGNLDLKPWLPERERLAQQDGSGNTGGAVGQAAQTAAYVVGFAGRLLGGAGAATDDGQRIFSSEPADISPLVDTDVKIRGKLGRLSSHTIVAQGIEVDAEMGSGKLDLKASAAEANGGPLSGSFKFDSTITPYPMALEVKAQGIHRRPEQDSYPTSLHFVASSMGMSEAELAAGLNGQVYLELGRGPMDYGGLTFLTADAASSMFRALIPNAKERIPEVRCGAAFMQIKDGTGVTPYGYAVQTREANLLGGIELDLAKEHVRIQFRSRSRKGVGISIGNAFSSTVELEGPLNDPRIVPNTPSLLVRGWAAFMTAGLSVLGESVFNRVLASENPCEPIKKEIREDVCTTDQLLSTSPLVCPVAAVATN